MSLPHEQDPHAGSHVAHQLAASSSSSSAPPPTASTSSHSAAAPNLAAAVRLPPVSLPSADLFANPAFAGGRRQSINSDPFLHAFSAAHDVGTGHARPGDPYRLTPTAGSSHVHDGLSLPNVHPQPGPSAPVSNGMDGNANGLNERWHPGLESGFPGYSSTSGTTQHNGLYGPPGEHPFAPSSSAGPLSSYRFGGPSQASLGSSAPAGAAPTDAPSFVDYSMRRASLSRTANEPVSPRRTPSGRASPTSGVKRKAQDEGDAGRGQSPYLGGPGQHAGGLPDSKRHTSALGGSDKLGQSAPLTGQQDMGLPAPHVAPWEEQRRDSGGSYGSSGGHSYSMTSYAPPHSMPSSSSTTYGSRPPSAPAPNQPVPADGSPWDTRPQQTHYNQLEQTAGAAMFPRRPSIPSVSQMMQGLPSGFVGGSNAQPIGPPGSALSFAAGAARPGQPSLTVSSVPPTPSEREQPWQSRSASNPAFRSAEPAPPPSHAKSRPDWQTHSQPSTRQNSSGSIHLDPLSLPGGLMNKDSPYSRSPELPIEYVAQLKSYSAELAEDNRNLRQHYGLPPGPAMAVHDGPIEGGSGGVAGSSHQYDDRPLQQSRGASPHVGLPMGVANAAPTAPSQQLQWYEQNLLDPDAMQDRKPNPAHFAKQTGHSPVIPSRLHSQFGTSSQHSTPQPSPTLPPSSTTGSGRNTPAAVGTGSPHPLERSMTGPPVSAA
ncbi:hypothetical protein RHOSPDRAFT_30928 [Rhodotorula sp. JG-1b]|nr:hypothetical protein RHOSPDRAFT_30928 [Rhodotorula sp. JG-1b]